MELSIALGLAGWLVLIVGAAVFGIVAQLVGDARNNYEWVVDGVAAGVGALVASEFIVAWQATGPVFEGLAILEGRWSVRRNVNTARGSSGWTAAPTFSVADTQDRKSQVIDAPVQLWRIGRVNAGGAPGKNDAIRCDSAERGSIRPEGKNLGIHAAFAYSPGDHLRVLRAEIDDDNLVLR